MKKTALIVLDGWGRADNPEVSAIDKAKEVFSSWGFEMRGAHEFTDAQEGCRWADGFFTGGGNTFVLTKTL
ncbi:MAG: hypothetical protein ISQ44_07625, partial [Cryomorphaceae bacterium]|nr:hypothetical protein [Cryomorphaceae bacterium]